MITSREELASAFALVECQKLAVMKMECGLNQLRILYALPGINDTDKSGVMKRSFSMWGCEFILSDELQSDDFVIYGTDGRSIIPFKGSVPQFDLAVART